MTESEPVRFRSILFEGDVTIDPEGPEPGCFHDLHLDQIVASVIAGREEYALGPVFRHPLGEIEAVRYRHQVLGDLERPQLLEAVRAFARSMRRMRDCLALTQKVNYQRQRQRWFLEAGSVYCDAVASLERALGSPGFRALRDYLAHYAGSERFASLTSDTRAVEEQLAAIRYTVQIKGAKVRVSRYEGQPDLSEEVERTFEKFKRGAATDYRVKFRDDVDMNHVEAQIFELVARLHPDAFAMLEHYGTAHAGYRDETIARFDREVQFYLAYLEHIGPLKAAGLAFSYPRVSARSKQLRVEQGFDLALASKLLEQGASVVANDAELTGPERILVVSGPNNGGKTTFARMFGQLHYLASLGLPVPGRAARLLLPDQIFTHFEREEELETLRGKFEDELFRIHEILEQASPSSLLVMNESFGSTTLEDAVLVGSEVLRQIVALDAPCLFVTFVDELSSLGQSTVSMMSTVVPGDPAVRTFKVVRKPADGLAYAAAIAERYGLSYESLRSRLSA